jgi:penicillin-binding protein 1A
VACAAAAAALFSLVLYGGLGAFAYLAPTLPTADDLRRRDRQIPLRVYSRSGGLIAQIGEQLRVPVRYDELPPLVREAFLSAEDANFFSHGGVDYKAWVRAIWADITTGDYSQGASTITMQVARNIFLSSDKNVKRKLQEIFLTYRMEHDFTKEQILSTYLNEIFFGQRAYGVAAAAEVYFGKSLNELTVAEAALLAGLPQAPSAYNPVRSPGKAIARRHYVLQNMERLGYIDAPTAERAQREPIHAREYAPLYDVEAPYVAEMVRADLLTRFGEQAVNAGYRVTTTIDGRLQTAANRAVRLGLIEYDRRHGYRGPLRRGVKPDHESNEAYEALLGGIAEVGALRPAVVVSVAPKVARVYVRGQGFAQIDWDGLSWAHKGGTPAEAGSVVAIGDVVYVVAAGGNAQLAQLPLAQGALVSLDPNDGAIVALVGGFDYSVSKFNRAVQAQRQPGSGFKPFLYSAALENGFTPASIIMDAPIMADDKTSEQNWRPKNDSGEFSGPMRLRDALVKSRNLVSIRLLRGMGPDAAIDYATRFGFPADNLPRNQTLALGTLSATPLEVVTGYAAFANNGYKVDPYLIDRIEDSDGKEVWRAAPKRVCESCAQAVDPPLAAANAATGADPATAVAAPADAAAGVPPVVAVPAAPRAASATACVAGDGDGAVPDEAHRAPRVISAANAWIMDDMLSEVITRGTGARARVLNRRDIAGKTGTTNSERDTWFNGFNRSLVASVWVGFDDATELGDGEQGSRTAVPIWVYFMREGLRGVPDVPRTRPAGLVSARIVPGTGLLARDDDESAIPETFIEGHLPAVSTSIEVPQGSTNAGGDSLF